MESVSLRGVTKAYRLGALQVPALQGIDLSVQPERFTVITGPSGSGKTTLLNLIGCIDRADAGEVLNRDWPVAVTTSPSALPHL